MRLALYSSKPAATEPNLVAIQDPRLTLPTLLVCPLVRTMQMTMLRTEISWYDSTYVVACDLARPIHRKVLRPLGLLGETASMQVMATFQRLLSRD